MPTIQHFEIPADDTDRAQKFYSEVFGWSMQRWENPNDPSQDYIMIETKVLEAD